MQTKYNYSTTFKTIRNHQFNGLLHREQYYLSLTNRIVYKVDRQFNANIIPFFAKNTLYVKGGAHYAGLALRQFIISPGKKLSIWIILLTDT